MFWFHQIDPVERPCCNATVDFLAVVFCSSAAGHLYFFPLSAAQEAHDSFDVLLSHCFQCIFFFRVQIILNKNGSSLHESLRFLSFAQKDALPVLSLKRRREPTSEPALGLPVVRWVTPDRSPVVSLVVVQIQTESRNETEIDTKPDQPSHMLGRSFVKHSTSEVRISAHERCICSIPLTCEKLHRKSFQWSRRESTSAGCLARARRR